MRKEVKMYPENSLRQNIKDLADCKCHLGFLRTNMAAYAADIKFMYERISELESKIETQLDSTIVADKYKDTVSRFCEIVIDNAYPDCWEDEEAYDFLYSLKEASKPRRNK